MFDTPITTDTVIAGLEKAIAIQFPQNFTIKELSYKLAYGDFPDGRLTLGPIEMIALFTYLRQQRNAENVSQT